MSLAPGTRLGPYEIVSPLGAGGMGEVYRARDTRLGREVAVKLLPEELSDDPERVSRLEREARSASALSHAHVVAVYDVGREAERFYIVTEIVGGGNLRDLLDRGPVPLRRALDLAVQIASGLAEAHESGIVHRDLKPENVLLTKSGDAKLADFGLAKLADRESGGFSQLPTSDGLRTSDGVVMGTAAYMSPEQAGGRPVDYRSDQFAFGSIFYEMIAGLSPFRRPSPGETMAAVLRDEPEPVRSHQAAVPSPIAWIVERCLAKDPAQRYASTRDLARELATARDHLSDLTGQPSAVPAATAKRSGRKALPWTIAVLALVGAVAIGLAWMRGRRAPASNPVVRFLIPPPPNALFFGQWDAVTFAVSPDGSRVAFIANTTGVPDFAASTDRSLRVWIRALSDLEAKPLADTEGASALFWSPDGRSIGFFSEGHLKRIGLDGGSATPICDIPTLARRTSGSWGAGEILFSSSFDGVIYRVAAEGGAAAPFHRPDAARGEKAAVFPQFLPDGKSFLYVSVRGDGNGELMEGSLDGGASRAVGPIAFRAEYCEPGFLLFARDGSLYAQRFDPKTAKLTGPLLSLAPSVYSFYSSKWAGFSISRNGTLAFRPRGNITRLTWFDRSGQALGELGTPNAGETITVRLSPDEKKVLFDRTRPDLNTFDLWTIDLARGVETRLTSDPNTEVYPVWHPDGRHIVYSVVRDFLPWLVLRDLAGEEEQRLLPPGTFQVALGVTPDGRRLLFSQTGGNDIWGIWSVSLKGDSPPEPLLVSKYSQAFGDLSPDGKFVAFISNASGQRDAYVRSIAGQSEPIRVSTNGVVVLRWSRDGKEIFYTSPDRHLFAVPVKTSPSLEVGAPRMLFSLPAEGWRAFDVAPDGRFLAAVLQVSYATEPLTVVVNALSELKQ